jgi:hypothetical protein
MAAVKVVPEPAKPKRPAALFAIDYSQLHQRK